MSVVGPATTLSQTPDQAPGQLPVISPPKRVLYFVNELVEDLLRKYIWTGCTRVSLRNDIMVHATELIIQIIRKQGLHTIYPGQDESSFKDLLQTAWIQIERTLYKFRAKPHCRPCFNPDRPNDSALYNPGDLEYGIITYDELRQRGIKQCPRCSTPILDEPVVVASQDIYGGSTSVLFRGNSKVFNMWSQIARTVILAHIKKEGRDRKNSPAYREHIARKLKHMPPDDGHTIGPDEVPQVSSDELEEAIKHGLETPCGPARDLMRDPVRPAATQLSDVMLRFLTEAREICKFSDDHLQILDALEHLLKVDDKPADGIIGKLVELSGLSRVVVTQFMRVIKLRSFEFTDSPITRASTGRRFDRRKPVGGCAPDEDD